MGDGIINIVQPGIANWNYAIANSQGVVVSSGVLNSSTPVNATMLSTGVYTVTLVDAAGYTVVKNINVGGVNTINAGFTMNTSTADVNQQVSFHNTTPNSVNYTWEFSDGTIITGIANPQMIYYDTGVFTVVLTCTNRDGCVVHDTITITVSQATGINETAENRFNVFSEGKNIFIVRYPADETEFEYEVLNVSGQAIASGNFTLGTLQLSLAEQANGIYIVRLYNKNTFYSKRIFAVD